MNQVFTEWRTVMLAFFFGCLMSCDGGDEPGNSENPQDWIERKWSLSSNGYVRHNGTDVSATYPNLSITFGNNGTYTTSNAKTAFAQSGTWVWEGTGTSKLILDGETSLTVGDLTKEKLRFSFTLTDDNVNTAGRTAAVLGSYEIELTAD